MEHGLFIILLHTSSGLLLRLSGILGSRFPGPGCGSRVWHDMHDCRFLLQWNPLCEIFLDTRDFRIIWMEPVEEIVGSGELICGSE